MMIIILWNRNIRCNIHGGKYQNEKIQYMEA